MHEGDHDGPASIRSSASKPPIRHSRVEQSRVKELRATTLPHQVTSH